MTFFKGGLVFPGAIALGTRAAIFARFCSTFSWASLSWEELPLWGSDSLLRLLGWPGGCPSDTVSPRSFVDVGCVNEIPFDFTADWEGMKVDVREDLEGIVSEAADNALPLSARSERRSGDREPSIEERVTLALPEDGVISTTVERLAFGWRRTISYQGTRLIT